MPMKSTCSLLTLLVLLPGPVLAQYPTSQTYETCRSYRHTETYEPGRIDAHGNYERGNVRTRSNRISCAPRWHHPTPDPQYIPVPVPSHQPQQTQSVPTDPRCSGKLARMGLGGILGGLAGRYAVGGKRSNKTVLGTTIGAFAGSLVGRATC